MTGVQTHLLWDGVDAADVDFQMDKAKAAGAGILRVDVGWSSIEQTAHGRVQPVVPQAPRRDRRQGRGARAQAAPDLLGDPVLGIDRARVPEAGLRRQLVGARGPALRAGQPGGLRRCAVLRGRALPRPRLRLGDLERAEPPRLLQGRRRRGQLRRARQGRLPGREGRRPERDDPGRLARRRRLRLHAEAARPRRRRQLRRLVRPPLQRRPVTARHRSRPMDAELLRARRAQGARRRCSAPARTSRCG